MRIALFVITVSVMLWGTVALAQSLAYDFDRTADFSRFRTYAWVRGNQVPDELNHRRVVAAIDGQLASKGMSMVDTTAKPDLFVAYHASFDTNLRIDGFSTGFGGYRFGGGRSGTATAEEFTVGTLAVDIVDAATKTIVWRAMATREIDVDANPQKREKNIARAVAKLFKHYPAAN